MEVSSRHFCVCRREVRKNQAEIVVVHENRGLNLHIEDVARRAALAGFTSLAPDALSQHLNTLKADECCNGKVGVVGFCFGGRISNMMAARVPHLAAAVPFYGGQAPVELVPNIKAPLLLYQPRFS